MLKKVLQTICEHNLFKDGDTVVIAVSGGADSVALFDILANLRELNLRLVVAHLNHQLRGDESDGDEAFVRRLAENYGVTFVTQAVDVLQLSREKKLSLEDAGRMARYRFFDKIAADCTANAVALAHHLDDQAETVLLRLLRGAAGSGLCAMAAKNRGYVRPLLFVSRVEIEAYLRSRGLSFRTDKSNADTNYLRNRIRHELIPSLTSYNPAISERLAATAEALTEDEFLLERVTAGAFAKYITVSNDGLSMDVSEATAEPRGLRYRLYRRAIGQIKGDLARIGHCHIKDIDKLLLSSRPNGKLSLPEGFVVRRRYGKLTFSAVDDLDQIRDYEFLVDGPGCYPFPGGVLTLEVIPCPENFPRSSPSVAYFDVNNTSFPWLVRNFKPGDRFVPLGMKGHKKVKDLYIDEKVPLADRSRIPLIFSGKTLLWVGCVRTAEQARVASFAKTIIRAEIQGFSP